VHLVLAATGDDSAIVRLLRALLKRLGRDFQVRCESITWEPADDEACN
jgi:hypothetical protein